MHEITLVQGLLKQLAELARQHDSKAISKVRVEIGPLSGIVIDSFQFGFDVLAAEEELTSKALLEIVAPPIQYKCRSCGHVCLNQTRMPDACPECSHKLLMPEGGDGLILLQVEMV
ncbi:MAG: hydrogenase maturation nickel metallochaperone HypA [Desulfobacterales bacterium]|nr:MAG: hydrogenase maturation nickel metallochaperone HypA [Desulfobacterales bacterium]